MSSITPHYGTVRKLKQEGIAVVPHRARQMTRRDYEEYDYLIGMDETNVRNMRRIAGGDSQNKICTLLSFAGRSGEIADPWYTGNFNETFRDVWEALR